MDPIAEFAVEAVGIEQREEKLEVLLLPAVRRGGQHQEVPGAGAKFLREDEASGLFEFGAEEMGGELMGLIENHQVP